MAAPRNITSIPPNTTSPADSEFIEACSYFSEHVYDAEDKPELPPDWTLVIDSRIEADDYAGACYVKGLGTSQPLVVFAHRGTTNLHNLVDDFNAYFGRAMQHIEAIHTWQLEILRKLGILDKEGNILNPNCCVNQAGHSLGGVFADIIHFLMNINGNGKSVSFENPGSFVALCSTLKTYQTANDEQIELHRKTCEVYLRDVNFINTGNIQSGATFRISSSSNNYTYDANQMPAPDSLNCTVWRNLYYTTNYSKTQHAIGPLRASIKNSEFVPVVYPVGTQQGYLAYLNYDKRKEYWDGYFQVYWDTNPKVRTQFSDNREAFFEYAMNTLRKISESTLDDTNIVICSNENKPKPLLGADARLFKTAEPCSSQTNCLDIGEFELLEIDNVNPPEKIKKTCCVM